MDHLQYGLENDQKFWDAGINLFVNELNCRIDGPLAVPPRNMESGINNPLRIRAWMGFR